MSAFTKIAADEPKVIIFLFISKQLTHINICDIVSSL